MDSYIGQIPWGNVKQKIVFFLPKVSFFIKDEDIVRNKKDYVVLTTVNHDSKFIAKQESFSPDKILLVKNFFLIKVIVKRMITIL